MKNGFAFCEYCDDIKSYTAYKEKDEMIARCNICNSEVYVGWVNDYNVSMRKGKE